MRPKRAQCHAYAVVTVVLLSLLISAGAAEPVHKPRIEYKADGAVRWVGVSQDGSHAVAGTSDGKVLLFSNASSAPVWSYNAGSAINTVGISADAGFIAAGTDGGRVLLFRRASSSPAWTAELGGSVTCLALSSDGTTLAAGSYLGALGFYATSSAAPIWNTTLGGSVLSAALPSAAGSLAAATSDGMLWHFQRASSVSDWNITTIQSFSSVAMSADGTAIAAGGRDGRVYLVSSAGSGLWNYSTGGSVNAVAISSDGSHIAAGTSMTNRLYLFSKASATPLWSAPGGSVLGVALSRDGSYIAAGGYDSQVYLYEKGSAVPLWKFTTGDTVNSVDVCSDGSLVAAGSEDGWFRILNRTIPNNPPVLSAGAVSPAEGNNATLFSYRVTFSDADDEAPDFIKAVIDSTDYPMSKVNVGDIDYVGGVAYEIRTTLALGAHTYRFEASDGKGSVRLPATGDYNGPNVVMQGTNTAPVLSDGKVSPGQGGTTTRFTFSVRFTDADNDAPSHVSLFIDGANRSMHKLIAEDIQYADGAEYRLETTLNMSAHSYHFESSDGRLPARFPASGEFDGPNVSSVAQNNPPVLAAPSLSPSGGNTSTMFTFSVLYTDVDDQLPAVKDLVLDGVSRSMVFGNGTPVSGSAYTLQTQLSAGVHRYHFSFSDGKDAVRLPVSEELQTPNITAEVVVVTPQARLNVTPLKIDEGGKITLDGRGSQGNLSAYYFDFGDGKASDWVVNPVVDHVYAKAGKYSPKLKVRDVQGSESYFEVGPEVVVEGKPSVEPPSPFLTAVLIFLAVAGGGAVVYFIAYTTMRLPGRRMRDRQM